MQTKTRPGVLTAHPIILNSCYPDSIPAAAKCPGLAGTPALAVARDAARLPTVPALRDSKGQSS